MDVMMSNGELKAYMCKVIGHMKEGSERYHRFSELFLTACGVIDAEGNLTEEYRVSPYWAGGDDGTPFAAEREIRTHGQSLSRRTADRYRHGGRERPLIFLARRNTNSLRRTIVGCSPTNYRYLCVPCHNKAHGRFGFRPPRCADIDR